MSKRRILLVGGGTGGHFYPLMAVAEKLQDSPTAPTLYYMGPNRYSPEDLKNLNITYLWCPAGKRRRYFSFLNLMDFFKNIFGIGVAFFSLFKLYPDVVFSKGGFTSVPVVFAAWLLRIPIVIHESDATPGSANRFASRFARYIAISYTDTASFFPENKIALTGIPIRKELLLPPEQDAHSILNIDASRPLILVLGGSQGAERINRLILDSLDELLPTYTILHQTGKGDGEFVAESAKTLLEGSPHAAHYHPVPFLTSRELNQAMHSAVIIVARAGSGTIYEIAAHGRPSILIPIPETISHDQRTNAYAYARTGAATVMEEENLTDGLLEAEIRRMIGDHEMYRKISQAAFSFGQKDAAETIANILADISLKH
jgi:UDP-N-acetylglucosamine--N-acetylmuramyl-(pentapeptide) pyrophosphoryl-undecaprenol N-acetylglucosamine transferase